VDADSNNQPVCSRVEKHNCLVQEHHVQNIVLQGFSGVLCTSSVGLIVLVVPSFAFLIGHKCSVTLKFVVLQVVLAVGPVC
jgi:hypothetical protein